MATPTDAPTMETSDHNVSEPTLIETDGHNNVSKHTLIETDGHEPTLIETDGLFSGVHVAPRRLPVRARGAEFKVTRGLGGLVENAQVLNVGELYLRQISGEEGMKQNQLTIVNNWGIYDRPDPKAAKLIAKTHGMQAFAGKMNNWFTIEFLEFVDQRFVGSTLHVMGSNDMFEENDWAIVGGTGAFEMARGIIRRRVYTTIGGLTQELKTIDFFCRMTDVVVPELKEGGSVGRNDGTLWEMKGIKSQRLETVTITHNGGVEGIYFSYIDENGDSRTVGTWGKGHPTGGGYRTEIRFGPSEFVKEIKGFQRNDGYLLCQFEIVTTHRTYGPFGRDSTKDNQISSYKVPDDEIVVGFFAKTNKEPWVTTIGVYTIPKSFIL